MNFIKLILSISGLILLASGVNAQSRLHKLGISAGGGPQDYKSNLGNGFSLSSETSWHGAAIVQLGNYLNPSLDLVFSGSIGDLNASRLQSVGIALKYKFANGQLMEEEAALKPYVYAGGGFNHLADRTMISNTNTSNYLSVNGGLGARYYVWRSIHIGYNLGMGYLIIDNANSKLSTENNELFFHNALLLGIDLL